MSKLSDTSPLGFRLGDTSELVVADDNVTTRAQLRVCSDELCTVLQQDRVSSAIVCSDDPVDLLRAIDACDRAGVDLYIAHTSLGGQVDDLVRSFAIEFRIGVPGHVLAVRAERSRGTPGLFLMTSGTTGEPKVAAHTLKSVLSRIELAATGRQNVDARWLLTYQPSGFAGLQVILTAALGRGVLVVPRARTPASFLWAARHGRVTQISGTPTFWRALLMTAPAEALAQLKLRQITLGGEVADQVTLDRLKRTFPTARITHTYASTEAGIVYAVHDGVAGFPREWLEKPNRDIELRIRDGFLHVKSANRMSGYAAASMMQPILEDGWLVTADRIEIRGDRAYILGRDDSTINVAGSKVYPATVENVLLTVPAVREARVYGISNPISGFLVAADVVLADGEDPTDARNAILEMCRTHLADYQVPRILKFVEGVAVAASGKKAIAQ